MRVADVGSRFARAQKKPGKKGFLRPVEVDGAVKVLLPEILVGLLLEMVSGSERTPKGGSRQLLEAHEAQRAGDASVVVAEPTGTYGRGAYSNEPWGVVAIRKRITSVRKFYDRHLKGEKRDVNPGWAPIVVSTMQAITLLLGNAPKHVSAVVVCISGVCVRGGSGGKGGVEVGEGRWLRVCDEGA